MNRNAGTLAAVAALVASIATSAAQAQTPSPAPDIAVLLPLSGEYRTLGQRALRSVAMAAEYHDDVVWRTYDSGPDPEAAYRAAVAEGAAIVLGPLGETETRALADDAAELGGPVLTVCSVDGIEDPVRGVYRLRSSLADQAEVLGAWVGARRDDGGRVAHVAVAAPDEDWGTEAVLGLVRGVQRGGGVVTHVARYPVDRPDYNELAAELAGERIARLDVPGDPWRAAPRSSRRRQTGDTRRFDALLIADYDRAVADILPFLTFAGLIASDRGDGAELLGVSSWIGPGLELVGDLAAGAHVVASWHVGDPRPEAESFALDYSSRYADDPVEFDAQVFDAAGFAFSLVLAVDPPPREAIAAEAIAAHRHAGATGQMALDSNGGVVRGFTVWEVNADGRLFPVYELGPDGVER